MQWPGIHSSAVLPWGLDFFRALLRIEETCAGYAPQSVVLQSREDAGKRIYRLLNFASVVCVRDTRTKTFQRLKNEEFLKCLVMDQFENGIPRRVF